MDALSAWKALPRRLYLDTSTLQTLFDYGETIWEAVPFEALGRDRNDATLSDEIAALRLIMAVNERAGFEFVVTDASIREVDARGLAPYAQWVRDVLDTWLVQSEGEAPAVSGAEQPGSVSGKDWQLLLDALAYRCDAFLTMERRLFSQALVIERRTSLRILRPTTYRDLLRPWAALYL